MFASTPTTSRRLLPVPTLKLESVFWYGNDDTVPDVVLVPFKIMPPDACGVADAGGFEREIDCKRGKSIKIAKIEMNNLTERCDMCFMNNIQICKKWYRPVLYILE